ncbi:hypothetical protein Tco_0464159 [Tanacetum coccineum]
MFGKAFKRVNTFVDYKIELVEVDDDQEKARMKELMNIIPDEENFDKEDLETLWKLVKAKHGSTRPEEGYERVLWGDLMTMFEPDVESMLNKKLQADHWNEMCYQLLKLITKQLKNPGSGRIVGIKSFIRLFGITAALIKVSAAQEERLVGLAGSGGGDIGNGDDTGSGGDGICGSGDEYDVSGGDGRVDMARSLSTSASDGNGIGV